jgi:hypothetical protein
MSTEVRQDSSLDFFGQLCISYNRVEFYSRYVGKFFGARG